MSTWFNSLGVRVSSFSIQKFSLYFRFTFIVSILVLIVFLICFIRVNFACLLKLWPGCLKCKDAGIAFGLLPLASFQWLLSWMLKGVSAFPTYCILRRVYSIRQITKLLLRFSLWKTLRPLGSKVWILLNPPTTDRLTNRPRTTYSPTDHRLTDPPTQ